MAALALLAVTVAIFRPSRLQYKSKVFMLVSPFVLVFMLYHIAQVAPNLCIYIFRQVISRWVDRQATIIVGFAPILVASLQFW